MARRKWTPSSDISHSATLQREKKKWQIALRRYVLERNPSVAYAPFFGLDAENMRQWIDGQFTNGAQWDNFGQYWQFDHIVPLTCFDFGNEADLRLCWNFTNIQVSLLQEGAEKIPVTSIWAAKTYFQQLWQHTRYEVCRLMLEKITQLEQLDPKSIGNRRQFIAEKAAYLQQIKNYSSYQFEQLNQGVSVTDIDKEARLLGSL